MIDCRDIGKNLVIISLLIGLGQKALAQRTAFPTGWNNQPCTFHSISLQIILQLIGLNFHRNARLGQLAEKVLLNIGAAKCRSEADGQFPTIRADTRLKLIGADKNIKAFDDGFAASGRSILPILEMEPAV